MHGAGASSTDAEVRRIVCSPCVAAADIFRVEPRCFFGNSVWIGSRLAATTYGRPCSSGASAFYTGTVSGSECSGIRVSAYPRAGWGCSRAIRPLTQGRFLGGNALSGFLSLLPGQKGPQAGSVPAKLASLNLRHWRKSIPSNNKQARCTVLCNGLVSCKGVD